MSTKAITEKPEERPMASNLTPGGQEAPPSVVREDDLGVPRAFGMLGAMLTIFGGMAMAFHLSGRPVRLSLTLSILAIVFGVAGLLFHAAFDRDVQFRRLYAIVAATLLALGAVLFIYPYVYPGGALAFRFSVPLMILALLFGLAFLRNEQDEQLRDITQYVLGGAGALMIVIGLAGGNIRGEFLLPAGTLLAVVGLVYLGSFVGSRGLGDDLAYRAGLAIGAAGLLVILVALVRSFLPGPAGVHSYFKSYGFLLVLLGLVYLALSALLCSDSAIAVLTKREISAFFYSPMAYLTLLGFSLVSGLCYVFFISNLFEPEGALVEPIVRSYIVSWFPVIMVLFVVPVLTMRLLSEEQRTATLEVLLTAPVSEVSVVISKFLAALLTYLVMWAPFALYLLAIPLGGGGAFDYRPLISFTIALVSTGAGFVSMGLFFSSLTRNQVGSGVLTFTGMLALLLVYFGPRLVSSEDWKAVFQHMSYIELWENTLTGKLVPRMLLFPLSMTVFFLFATVKVLESRKWR